MEKAKAMSEFSIEEFGGRVTELRESKEWSPAELSRQAELNQSTIGRVEAGQMPNLSLRVAWQLAEALGVTLDYLCEGDE